MKPLVLIRSTSFALAIAIFGSLSASAIEVATDPVGFITGTTGSGGSIASPKLNLVAPTLVQPVLWQGLAATITATTITSGTIATGWTVNQFNDPANPTKPTHYVEIVTGSNAGAWTDISTTGTNTLTVADDLTSFSTGNVSVRIRKHMTISDFLGTNNSAGLLGGNQLAVADEVQVYDGSNKSIYFFYDGTQGGSAGWYDSDFNPASDAVIAPNQAVVILRKASPALGFKVTGSVKTGTTFLPVVQNINVLPEVSAAGLTLDSSNLYTGNSATGVLGGNQTTNADEVTIYTPLSQTVHFYYDGQPGAGWYDSEFALSGTTAIPPGSSIVVKRKPPGIPFNWKVPGPNL